MFVVYDKEMNLKPFPNGVIPLDIHVSSISKNRTTDTIEGRNGIITKGQTHYNRPINISVGLMANDTRDYRLLRDEVFSFFDDNEFYISESYQKGKRYKVTTLQSYIPERLNKRVAQAQFLLDMVELPFAESIGTTQDIHENGISSEDALWGYGMGLIDDPDSLIYTHTSNSFRIYNAGNVPIHPFEQELKITISNLNAPEFTLTNVTNGTEFKINEEITDSQTIVLDGPNITSNGLAFLRSTNKKFIELAPGWNEFEASTDARVSFAFPFYYK